MELLQAGKIVNTHGLQGEVKIQPWADSPEFIAGFKKLYIDGDPKRVLNSRVHKGCVIVLLEGISGIDGAIKVKNKIVSIEKSEAKLDKGRYFVVDLCGLEVYDIDSKKRLGVLADVMTLPANDVYVVKGDREILIPAVPEFIKEVKISDGYMKVRLIEGM